MKAIFPLLLCTLVLSACQPATPPPADTAAADATPAAPASPAPAPAPAPATPATAPAASDLGAQLPRFHWRLSGATDGSGQKIAALFAGSEPLQLDFADGRVSVGNLCNRMGGGFTLQGDKLAFGRLASTLMACTDPAKAAQERAAAALLAGEYTAALAADAQPPTLALTGKDGTRLLFQGEETAESRYGQGETVFMEVAAQTKPCPHPLIKDKQCLQVREVRFDDKGLRQGEPGPWQNFYDEIEGYRHEPGIRNVVRVKRYTRPNPPADASANVYVLDMVVESEKQR